MDNGIIYRLTVLKVNALKTSVGWRNMKIKKIKWKSFCVVLSTIFNRIYIYIPFKNHFVAEAFNAFSIYHLQLFPYSEYVIKLFERLLFFCCP